jgi:hypothetical protein
MAYIRCDKDCNALTVQPGNINVTDTFGNTNDFFHVDYKKKDKDNNVIPHFDPNVPQNNLRPFDTTVLPNGRGGILFFDTNWTRHLSDNSPGTKDQYVQGLYFPLGGTYPPGHPDVGSGTYIVNKGDKYSSSQTIQEPVYLSFENDHDLWIVDEANDDVFVVDYNTTTILDSGLSLNIESGGSDVTSESGNPVDLVEV